MASPALHIDPRDNLAVALRDLNQKESIGINGESIVLPTSVPAKHKFALESLAPGDSARMYGVTIGQATRPVTRGELLSTENLRHESDGFEIGARDQHPWATPDSSAWKSKSFDGFSRSNSTVGTANHWIVVPLVFCENRNIAMMREALEKALGFERSTHYQAFANQLANLHRNGAGRDEILAASMSRNGADAANRLFPNIDGVKFLTHGMGCGGTRDDARTLCGLLAGYITHPNVAGATVLSLGCQNAQAEMLMEEIEKRSPAHDRAVLFFEQQKWPSEKQMLEAALRETFAGIAEASTQVREPAPLSKLIFGMECGGSDGFSGISANPVIGHVSDLLVDLGGSVILSEFPELCGVEQELLNRCSTDATAQRFAELMQAYAARAEAVGSALHENPSPGNIADGLITDAMKSAGAAKKGGTSPVNAVLDYPEWVCKPGLNLLCTPGGDVESTTAMAGAHANLMFFSTGLGTPTGNPVAPVLKISSNTELASRLPDLIDFDTGAVIRGESTVEELGGNLLDLALEAASGRIFTKAQQLGQDDFLPWKRGVSL